MNTINGLLNNVIAQSQMYFTLTKEKISGLTPVQQKVAALALVVISSLTLIYLVTHCCYIKAKKIESEEADLQTDFQLDTQNQQNSDLVDQVKEVQVKETQLKNNSDKIDRVKADRIKNDFAKEGQVKEKEGQVKEKEGQVKEDLARENLITEEKAKKEQPKASSVTDDPGNEIIEDPAAESSLFEIENASSEDLSLNIEKALTSLMLETDEEEDSEIIAEIEKGSLQTEKFKKPVSDRLEGNRKDAAQQQEAETAKGFTVKKEEAPKFVLATEWWEGRPIHGEGKTVNGRAVGLADCQGKRSDMEDADIADFDNGKYPFEVYGVFDGHNGAMASDFVKQNITAYLKEALEANNSEGLTDEGIFQAIKQCFINLDADYQGHDGTTATAAFVLNGKIWVANVGDARTILVNKEGNATQASEDAKPSMERYHKTIEKLGGHVLWNRGPRVNGILAVARAVGDKQVLGKEGNCCISPNPKITCYSLADFEGGYLVAACDGLYDVATTNEVGQAIHEMAGRNEPVESMSHKLVYHAIEKGSADNVTALVVRL